MSKEVIAKLSYLRESPRKVRLVADLIRGRDVNRARQILSLTNKKAARAVGRLLNSAVANAKNNFNLEQENLRVSKIMVDGGATLKRWMPKAHGRATPVRERTSYISLTLTEIIRKEKAVKKDNK